MTGRTAPSPTTALQVRIKGLVQGVGFRPFVWRLANEENLTGHVLNDAEGVLAEVWGAPFHVDRFLDRLKSDCPPLARIESVETQALSENTSTPPEDFQIIASAGGSVATGIVPDAATCPNCVAEIFDPADRRSGYAFTNCTHCGPRLSVVSGIPYDRASTSMAPFVMCTECQSEYDTPADRRFHAQPNACPACGPKLWCEVGGANIKTDDPIAWTADRIAAGDIIAIKGIGGFHLTTDATSTQAVDRLRDRKHRPHKPLAVMVRDVEQARTYCHVSDQEAELLEDKAAPIVLLRVRAELEGRPGLSDSLAPGLDQCGIMLPYTPLHHLLMAAVSGPIVMTSGNLSEDPQVIGNQEAAAKLAQIADGFLMHDREIVNRLDDSVMRMDRSGPVILRRARGLAPAPLALADGFKDLPSVLSLGGELKSTFCLLRDGEAVVSQHMGDLESRRVLEDFEKNLGLYRQIYYFEPEQIAVDAHPDYLSSQIGRRLAADKNIPLIEIQHHYAHLAACLAEHGISPGADPSLAIVLDGSGLGSDGTIWGGEILIGGYEGFERAGHFLPVPLPGGAAAVREPWRNLAAHLHMAFGENWQDQPGITSLRQRFKDKNLAVISQMISKGLNAPLSSSAGRLFDAVAAAVGVCPDRQSYEGQTGALLESLARPYLADRIYYPVDVSTGNPVVLSWTPFWETLCEDLQNGVAPGQVSARFHLGLIQALSSTAAKLAGERNISRIVLSGGVLQNAILADGLLVSLTGRGFEVLFPRQFPANDGGLSLGQAAIAAVAR
ncbi:carbamoyltransferase HypF [Labrenzia sp. PHM005]|uniref:carbamoyltransferase HypF n=1 Tax=Labrenzia sp. PHM005 TaxID=2590016 RepID=UPI001140484F|nr:carbamoyltransferase HypF [Labrenzia sp. PHM005]QDG78729.1 carbamoyltransferase HypF [Labrenzia sp. PHM005]